MSLRALIFDVDGTLALTERTGHRPAFNAAFAEVGLDWYWDETRYGELLAIAGGQERLRHYAQQHDPALCRRADFEELLADIYRRKTAHYQAKLAQGAIPLRPDIGRLICAACSHELRLAIASSSRHDNVVALLQANLGPQAERWFEVIATGEQVAAKKPAPDIYLWTLAQLDLPAHDCLAIEDSAHGLAASTAAGIATVIMTNDYSGQQDFSGARRILPAGSQISLAKLHDWHASLH